MSAATTAQTPDTEATSFVVAESPDDFEGMKKTFDFGDLYEEISRDELPVDRNWSADERGIYLREYGFWFEVALVQKCVPSNPS
jgi:hypothetical protein